MSKREDKTQGRRICRIGGIYEGAGEQIVGLRLNHGEPLRTIGGIMLGRANRDAAPATRRERSRKSTSLVMPMLAVKGSNIGERGSIVSS